MAGDFRQCSSRLACCLLFTAARLCKLSKSCPGNVRAVSIAFHLQVLEFVKFKERLEMSHTSAVAAVEAHVLGLRRAGQEGLAALRVGFPPGLMD